MSEPTLRCVLESMPCGVVVAGLDARIVLANRTAGLLFEPGAGVPGAHLVQSACPAARAALEAVFIESRDVGFSLRRELTLPLEDGVELPATLSGSLARESGDAPGSVVLIVQDATLDVELVRRSATDASHAGLVAEASHEIRNPMTAVLGTLEVLLAESSLSASGRQLAGFAHREAKRVVLLARDILDSARLETKDGVLDRTSFDVGCLLAESVAGVRASMPIALVRVEVEPGLPFVRGNRELLDRVLRNLIENALKYSPPTSEVLVAARRVESAIEIAVTDRGIGIPQDELPRVFQKFFRTSTTRHRKIPGYGLGLAMVKSIVEAHGGHATVESELGKGSTFRVRLPV